MTTHACRNLPAKAPGDRLDYAFDFDDLACGELPVGTATITASPATLTITPGAPTGDQVPVWIEDGAPETLYALTCSVPSSQGRQLIGRATLYVGPVGLDDDCAAAPFV